MRFVPTPWRARRDELARGEDAPFLALQDGINRMFDDVFRGFGLQPLELSRGHGEALPRVDVSETDTHLRVTAELPGVEPKDLEVLLEDGGLSIRGEKRAETEKDEGGLHRRERVFGSFQRRIPLPVAVREDTCKATFQNGLLTVELEKSAPEEKARRIEVRSR